MLARSYAYCERLARREAGNFYHAFRVLPRPQRRAMCALYAFMRVTDDTTDGPGLVSEKQSALACWREQLEQALLGDYVHPLYPDLHAGVRNEDFRRLMDFQVQRARHYYAGARPLSSLLSPAGRAVFQVMAGTYESLLNAIEKSDYDVFRKRIGLSRWRKLGLVMQAMPARLGWGWEGWRSVSWLLAAAWQAWERRRPWGPAGAGRRG